MRSRRRKPKHEEHENHERWLVSYADFITLLFAFFVVMYAISSVNEGKYRVLSNALDQAFNASSMQGQQPIELKTVVQGNRTGHGEATDKVIGEGNPSPIDFGGPGVHNLDGSDGDVASGTNGGDAQEAVKAGTEIYRTLQQTLQPLVDRNLIELRAGDESIEIEMKSNVLFSSGRADVVRAAVPVLKELGTVLRGFANPVTIEGYTDSQPIANSYYASNWELSAARAASVAHLLDKLQIRADRLTAVGYGENRAIADNNTAEGRQRNRRVVMVIATSNIARDDSLDKQSAPVQEQIKPWEKITLEGPGALGTTSEADTAMRRAARNRRARTDQ